MSTSTERTTNAALALYGYTTAPAGNATKWITAPDGTRHGPFTALECSHWLDARHPGAMDGTGLPLAPLT